MWFGTRNGGVSRYDGKAFVTFTTEDGLANDTVWAIHGTPDGTLWFGTGGTETTGGGVSRYHPSAGEAGGQKFATFTTKDGLAHPRVYAIYRDPEGRLWFGTGGGGVSVYDGVAWSSLDTADGLAGDDVFSIHPDADGALWFGTDQGATRYRRSTIAPRVHIVSVTTNKTYLHPTAIPTLTTRTRATVAYNAIDFKTLPEKRQYRVGVIEGATDSSAPQKHADYWLPPTKAATFDHTFDKPGTYTVTVQAIDRDLNYSEPVTVMLEVNRALWQFILAGMLLAGPPLAYGFYQIGKRRQTQRAIAQQFNPYIAGRVVGEDLLYGRSDLLTDIERTLHNNCFLLYGERRIGKTSLQHQLRERLSNADDPTYLFIPAYIDMQGVAEEDFFHTIATSVVEACRSFFREELVLRLDEERESYTYRDLNRDLRTILNHLQEGEGTKTIKLVLLMDEIDTLNGYELRTNLNLRGLFMGPHKENLVLVMSGLNLKMDWSEEGGGSPPFNFLSREIQIQPLEEAPARQLITEPAKGFYTYEPKAVDLILSFGLWTNPAPISEMICAIKCIKALAFSRFLVS